MAKARIELRRAETYSARGRTFKKGSPVVIDSDGDIAYFKAQPEFTVTILKPVEAPKPVKASAPPPPPPPEDAAPAPVTAEQLSGMSKSALQKLGAGVFALDLGDELKKPAMIAAILEAQSADGDDDDSDD